MVNLGGILHTIYICTYILLNTNTGPIYSVQTVCQFNKLCFCSNYTVQLSEVTCLGVNVRLDELPERHFYRIRIIGARDLAVISKDDLTRVRSLSSLTLSRNRLSSIDSQAFATSGVRQTLTTLELSNSELREFPSVPLAQLPKLQWLSLRANKIEELKARDFVELKSLRSLLLSDNSVSVIHDNTFAELSSLEFLDLDDNMITRLEGQPFPSALITLSMSNCLLQDVPYDALANLENLQILQLRGNLIRHLPHWKFSAQNLQMLDLSHNLISTITASLFTTFPPKQLENINNPLKAYKNYTHREVRDGRQRNTSSGARALKYSQYIPNNNVNANNTSTRVRIKDLHLDFNFIQSLPSGLFGHISCERLSLSNNRITSQLISDQAFDGPLIHDLKALDLNYNLIDCYPNALKSLRNIRQILLKNNRIKQLDNNSFTNCSHSLEVLDLSRNLMSEMPGASLAATRALIKLSLYGNSITRLNDNDLGDWAQTLLSLSLSKNSLKYISGDAFRHAKNLRELRLAGNTILHANPHTLTAMPALELLELSDALNYVNSVPVIQSGADIGSFSSLKWLQLDYNGLRQMPFSLTLNAMKSLIHCDLESNQIAKISSEFAGSANLTAVILSRNQLSVIKSHTFSQLPHLETVALYLNHIHTVESEAFKNLAKLKTIIMSKNSIDRIDRRAFDGLGQSSPSLSILLDENRLKCFSSHIFGSMDSKSFLYINVSHNEIKQLSGCTVDDLDDEKSSKQMLINNDYIYNYNSNNSDNDSYNNDDVSGGGGGGSGDQSIQTVSVRVLDVSYNQIQDIPHSFIDIMCQSLHSLHLNHNRLIVFPLQLLHYCPRLQILILNNNFITGSVNYTNESHKFTTELQVLSLRSNKINSIAELIPIFKQLTNLRHLDLSYNYIMNLPDNAFEGTIISTLHLSHNRLINAIELINSSYSSEMDLDTDLGINNNRCWGVGGHLIYLDLSHNYLNSMPISVMSCEKLIELSLAHNRLGQLSPPQSSSRLTLPIPYGSALSWRQIDLSDNPIKHIDSKSFIFLAHNLNALKLNNVSLSSLPTLHYPRLTHLEVSRNAISAIDPQLISMCRELRHLDLSHNLLQDVPRYLWRYMTKLHTLYLQYNPIDILDTSSFSEFKNLRHLDIRGLNLQYIDTRLLHNHKYLLSLKSSTYPNVRSFRLHDLLAKSYSLRSALIEVQETTLSHQIQWAFGAKLKELIITGKNLIKILPDAFLGLYNSHDLTLRVTDTNISSLPSGLLKYLADIRFITIDLSKNKLKSLKPDVFLVKSDNKLNKNWESQPMLGGILLDENPLDCDCDLIWISDWMKKLISDMRVVNMDAALQAHTMASMSKCIAKQQYPIVKPNSYDYYHYYNSNASNDYYENTRHMRQISLLDLRPEDIFCQNISYRLTSSGVLIILLIVSINRLCFSFEKFTFYYN